MKAKEMLALDILFHVLELAATFAVGAWTGSSHCRVAFFASSDEERRDSWLDRLRGCAPRWRRAKSMP